MGFSEKLKMAFKKIKGKLIVAAILVLVILVWGVAPYTVAIKTASFTPVIDPDTQEFVLDENGMVKEEFSWDVFFVTLLGVDEEGNETEVGGGLRNPFESLVKCFTEYFAAYMYTCKWFLIFYAAFALIGLIRAIPKHEYENIENGSSDWSENGEQYQVLSRNKGIILAEKNYLPIDKRGNVNVLVVRRFWCW